MTRLIILIFGCLFSGSLVFGADHFIRQGAGGSADGSDWTNAWTDVPSAASLVRGDTYYFADGDYAASAYTMSKAESGTAIITFVKATGSNHGTETGWSSTYGDGVATFGPNFAITAGYFVMDGAVGGGPSAWESGHGFSITTTNTANIRAINLAASLSSVTIRHMLILGPNVAGVSTGIYNNSGAVSAVTVEYCWITGHGEGLMRVHDATDWVIQYNAFTTNPAAEPDHHGSGITFWGTCDNVQVRWNRFRNVRGTGWCGLYAGTHDDWAVYGNIFFTTDGVYDVGNGCIYNADSGTCTINGMKAYNNTFFNLGSYNLVAIFSVLGTGGVSENNLAYSASGVLAYGVTGSANTTSGSDPFTDSGSYDFTLAGATAAGNTLSTPFNLDMAGATRGEDGGWDRGALEYDSGADPAEFRFKPAHGRQKVLLGN